jgi:hypothetical protein
MSAADVAAALTAQLDETAKAQAPGRAVLASVSMDLLSGDPIARLNARLERKTRTLVFTEAEGFSASGALVARASAVHRIADEMQGT